MMGRQMAVRCCGAIAVWWAATMVLGPTTAAADDWEDWCKTTETGRSVFHVCVDVSSNGSFEFHLPGGVLRTNQRVRVTVNSAAVGAVSVKLTVTATRQAPPVDHGAQVAASIIQENAAARPNLYSTIFEARGAGAIELTVKIDGGLEGKLDMVAAQAYSGALRFGFGVAFAGAVDRAYEVRTFPGATQSEIAETTRGTAADLEIVLGYAPFLRPRTYADRQFLDLVAPYIGVGVVGQTGDNKVRPLTSLYLGFEVAPSTVFSVAGTLVLRRVTRLSAGLEHGSAAEPGSAPTRQRLGVGFGVVINVSPEFLNLVGMRGGAAR